MAGRSPDVKALVLGLLGVALACGDAPPPSGDALAPSAAPSPAPSGGEPAGASPPAFVGSARCAGCHPAELAAFEGSHHDRAMQEATPEHVLGDFDDARLDVKGRPVRFFRRGDDFFVHTEGRDGVPADFQVRYTFGVEPLQQYLVELPGGRLQALTAAWDSRPAGQGGQRWFSLHPDEDTPPGDVLHWTGAGNRWNSMCAACHSTNLRRGFDLERDRYDTRWSDLDVGCEACHGPGSRHLAWAEAGAPADEPSGVVRSLARDPQARWVMDETRGIARRDPARSSHDELETCAPCHSRRSQLSEDVFAGHYLDSFVPALLAEGLYFPDGQIRDEVYVYGSFLQSRMFAAGVTCSDCHEPHSLSLRGDGESVCARCHASARFATREHHHHEPGSEGARCVSCHMPSRTYMQIDERRDHSFRIPRPDLSGPLGTPNACDGCHAERGSDWASARLSEWRGGAALPRHFGEWLAAARDGVAGSDEVLARLSAAPEQPAIVRATALAQLGRADVPALRSAVQRAADDPEPLLRLAAARSAEALPLPARSAVLVPLLRDSLRAVRSEAARALAELPPSALAPDDRRALASGLDEYRASQRLASDEPQAHVNLALLHQARSELAQAEEEYRRALEVGPYFVPAYVNLADLMRATGRDDEAEPLLLRARELAPASAEVHQALGLLLVRRERREEALVELAAAARLAPERAHFAYVHGLALQSVGRGEEAISVWQAALRRHPHDAPLLLALTTSLRDAGRLDQALGHAQVLESVQPGDPGATALRAQLEAALGD